MAGNLTRDDSAFVRELLQRRAAIVLDDGKDYLLELRLEQAARENGFDDIAAFVARVRSSSPQLDTKIVEALTTHETSFLRDLAPFEAFRRSVLPELIAARARTKSLTIWSAACATGQ